MESKTSNINTAYSDLALMWSGRILVGVVWVSAIIFGLNILAFYFLALLQNNPMQWNEGPLPELYDPSNPTSTIAIGVHFAAGGIILILGSIQLVKKIRQRFPVIHRWLGRLYVLAAMLTAIGGLLFIFIKGTIGGVVMDVGFAGYGVLTFGAAAATIYYARKGEFSQHRAWAIRLYALAIGSWLYRMDYGFWFLFTDGLGHNSNFGGYFDNFMSFFFYLPNLLVAEIFIGKRALAKTGFAKWSATLGITLAILFLSLATYFFTDRLWGPNIMNAI
jgi:uncharacterized membrane protein